MKHRHQGPQYHSTEACGAVSMVAARSTTHELHLWTALAALVTPGQQLLVWQPWSPPLADHLHYLSIFDWRWLPFSIHPQKRGRKASLAHASSSMLLLYSIHSIDSALPFVLLDLEMGPAPYVRHSDCKCHLLILQWTPSSTVKTNRYLGAVQKFSIPLLKK